MTNNFASGYFVWADNKRFSDSSYEKVVKVAWFHSKKVAEYSVAAHALGSNKKLSRTDSEGGIE